MKVSKNGVPREREKEKERICDFLKSTSDTPPYYAKGSC
jgi:hypothetical protein